jgi:hypothetical protein
MVHGSAGGQFGLQAVEGRRGAPGSGRVPGVGGQVPQRQDAPPGPVGEAGCTVHGQEVEEDRVAGLQGEPANVANLPAALRNVPGAAGTGIRHSVTAALQYAGNMPDPAVERS